MGAKSRHLIVLMNHGVGRRPQSLLECRLPPRVLATQVHDAREFQMMFLANDAEKLRTSYSITVRRVSDIGVSFCFFLGSCLMVLRTPSSRAIGRKVISLYYFFSVHLAWSSRPVSLKVFTINEWSHRGRWSRLTDGRIAWLLPFYVFFFFLFTMFVMEEWNSAVLRFDSQYERNPLTAMILFIYFLYCLKTSAHPSTIFPHWCRNSL
jgi:hypothetical protein